jgi:hypothetical protein
VVEHYEEYQPLGRFTSWIILLAFALVITGAGWVVHLAVAQHHERHWDFYALPDAPGESIYSNVRGRAGLDVPAQFPKLPNVPPLEEFKRTHARPGNIPEGWRGD